MKTLRLSRVGARVALVVMAAVCPLTSQAQLGVSAVSTMKVPVVSAGSVDLGVVPAAQTISVVLYLAPDAGRQAALEQFLVDVQTPGSASYHAWLTPAEFGARFGASSEALAAVKTFAAANGLGVAAVSDSGLRVTLTGTATQVESALAPAIHAYRSGSVTFLCQYSRACGAGGDCFERGGGWWTEHSAWRAPVCGACGWCELDCG